MVRLAVKSATSARSLVFVVEPSQATATFAAERVCRCCPEGFPTQPSILAQSHLTSRSGSRTAPVVLDRDPTSELMPDLNLGPFVVPWARLLVRVRRLQDKVLAVTLGNDLQSAWKAGVGESGAHGCAGMAAHVERIGEHDGVQRVLERLAIDLGRHRTLRGKGLGRKHGTQQQVEALEHALAPIVELAAASIRGAVMLPRDASRAFGAGGERAAEILAILVEPFMQHRVALRRAD